METLRLRDHLVLVDGSTIILKDLKGGETRFTPGEITKARELVGTVWKMTSLPAMPSRISNGGDMFCTVDNDTVEFKKVSVPNGNTGFRFPINECDFVIDALDMGLNKCKDITALDPQPRATGAYTYGGPNDGDIIDGKL